MYKTICLTILCLLIIFGCPAKSNFPIQADESVVFGHYKFSPPTGYWYFYRRFPKKFTSSKDIFLITFYKDKNTIPDSPPKEPVEVFFNFAVSINQFKDFISYYEYAKSFNVTYEQLPEDAKILEGIANWSCKYSFHGLHGIECIAFKDNLITMGVFGSAKAKVLAKAPVLRQMVESLTVVK